MPELDSPETPVRDLAEAIAHLRNVAEIPGRLVRTGSAAKLVLERLEALEEEKRQPVGGSR